MMFSQANAFDPLGSRSAGGEAKKAPPPRPAPPKAANTAGDAWAAFGETRATGQQDPFGDLLGGGANSSPWG